MSNNAKCHDCPTVLPRGLMHVRSRSLEQVFYCPSCWEWRLRLAQLARMVRGGVAA